MQVLLQRKAERRTHLAQGPVRQPHDLEAPRQALGQTPAQQQRRRTEDHDTQREPGDRVLVPEPFDCLRPAGDLLDLVEGENRTTVPGAARLRPRLRPALGDPRTIAQCGLVGRDVRARRANRTKNLQDQGALADLARPGDNLEKPARFAQAPL